jgi:hypothetical protein
MSIQKKSLISALKTTKKANLASAPTGGAQGADVTSMGAPGHSVVSAKSFTSAKKIASAKRFTSAKKIASAKRFTSAKKIASAKRLVD